MRSEKTGTTDGETMNELNDNDRKRIRETLEYGTDQFTEKDLEKLKEESSTAEEKSKSLGDELGSFSVLWSLLHDYWDGEYRAVPWRFLAAIGFSVTYLVSPLDIVPDFIPFIGFVDDATVFALVVSSFRAEIDAYRKWKNEQKK